MNRKRPKCEICKEAEAERFTLTTDGLWYFMCDHCEDTCPNFLMGQSIEHFLQSKTTMLDSLISLNKFRLMNWTEFFKMITRFMETTAAGELDVWTKFYWGDIKASSNNKDADTFHNPGIIKKDKQWN